MAPESHYKKEQLRYFCLWDIIINRMAPKLREILKSHWKKVYHQEWINKTSGELFYQKESGWKRSHRSIELRVIREEIMENWDCTSLFYALLGSDAIGRTMDTDSKARLEDLRTWRNHMAHAGKGELTEDQFDNLSKKITTSLSELGCSIDDINELLNQETFPTEYTVKLSNRIMTLEAQISAVKSERKSFCILPQKPEHHITERKAEVKDICSTLEMQKQLTPKGMSSVYLSGNPGSGKSQLARQVGCSMYADGKCDFVMTLNAETTPVFLQSMEKFSRELGCSENVIRSIKGPDEEKLNRLKSLVLSKLKGPYSYWLVIIDNTSGDELRDYWPQLSDSEWGTGQVLITTQDEDIVPFADEAVSHISLKEGMFFDDAVELLTEISTVKPENDDIARFIFDEYDKQPLALAHAALEVKFIVEKENPSYCWDNFRHKVETSKKQRKRRHNENLIQDLSPIYPRSMFEATYSCAKRMWDSDPVLENAFHFIAVCSSQEMPLEILVKYICSQEETFDEEDFISAKLCECSLLIQHTSSILEENGDETTVMSVSVHQVVHHAFREIVAGVCSCCNAEALFSEEHCIFEVAETFANYYSEFLKDKWEHSTTAITKLLIPHLHVFENELHRDLKPLNAEKLLNLMPNIESLADCVYQIGSLFLSNKITEWVVAFRQTLQGKEHPDVGFAKATLGMTLNHTGQLHSSRLSCQQGVEILEKTEGNTIRMVKALLWLGSVEEDLGDFKGAKEKYQKALLIGEDLDDVEHSHALIKASNYMAILHHRQGEYDQAKKMYMRTEEAIHKMYNTEDNPYSLTNHNNLGWLLSNTRELNQSLALLEKSLSRHIAFYGRNSYNIAYPYINLGIVHRLKGNLEKALSYSLKAVQCFMETFGEENLEYCEATDYLGMVYYEQGKLDQARKCHKTSLNLWEKQNGTDHPKFSRFLENMANVESELGNFILAQEYYERSLAIKEKVYGETYPEGDNCYDNFGILLSALGQVERGTELIQNILRLRQKYFGDKSPLVAESYLALGVLNYFAETYNEAEKFLVLATELFKNSEHYGENHYKCGDCLYYLGLVQFQRKEYKNATKTHEKASLIYGVALGERHPKVAASLFYAGITKMGLSDVDCDYLDCVAALEILKKFWGEKHWKLVPCLLALSSRLLELDRKAEAKSYLENANEICQSRLDTGNFYVRSLLRLKSIATPHS